MTKLSDDESAFSALTRQPIAPFSAFINDLNRPLYLNNIRPSDEIIRAGLNFPASFNTPISIPEELFACPSFNPSKIVLNDPPVKEITHEYNDDELMLKILEQCYESKPVCFQQGESEVSKMTIPKPKVETPVKQLAKKASCDTPTNLKVKLTVTNVSSDSMQLLKKLVSEEAFVSPLCFDCRDDLKIMMKIVRSFSESPPKGVDCDIFNSLASILSKHMEEVCERLEENDSQIDSTKAMYCMLIIGFLNIDRLSTFEALKSYNSFDLVMRLFSLCDDSSSSSEGDLILSVVLESYMGLLKKFKIQDSEVSSYLSHLMNLCFDSKGIFSNTSSIIALSQVFTKYKDYRSYILDQILIRASDPEVAGKSKVGTSMLISCLQALLCSEEDANKTNLVSSFVSSCLSYCWKGDSGTELSKGSLLFFSFIEELQNTHADWHWPVVSTILNQCTIQMFHYLLKDESNNNSISNPKGSPMLKLRFLDILPNISKVVTSTTVNSSDKRSLWNLIAQNTWHSLILSPKIAFESLNQTSLQQNLNEEYFLNFLQSGPLSKIPERVTGLFIKLISCETTQLRSKAIKNLFTLMGSAQLCKSNYIALKSSILVKASDPSISVRDAVLEFISKLIFSPPLHDENQVDLIENVLLRIKDKGVSVRKRAVKVIGEVLQKGLVNGSFLKISCISKLISHIPDEDDEVAIEGIFKTLKDQWIMCYLGKEFYNSSPMLQRKIMSSFAEEVIQIITASQSGIKPLQDFLARILKDESVKNSYTVFFSGTVEVLLENLLQSLERNELSGLKSSLESISLFSEFNPMSLEAHLGLLQSLLRSDDSDISLLSMKLIHCVLPRASLAELKKLQDFEKDLLGLIYRGSEVAVKYSIETLYHYVNNCSHQYGTLSGLWQKFTDYLKSRMNDEEFEASSAPHICRALIATGVLCAQSSLHREREFGLKDFHNGTQSRCLLELISFYSRVPVIFIRSCTIQAFGSLLLASPQISISSFEVCRCLISSSLAESEDDLCKLKMLSIFDQMIQVFNAETPLIDVKDNIPINTNTNNTSKNNILSMEGDESYFSALLQEHFKSILNCAVMSESFEVRAISLKIGSSAAILGLVNPQLIVPYLAIELNSENEHIQAYSRSSFERLITRFPTMIGKDLLFPSTLLFQQQFKLMLKSKNENEVGFNGFIKGNNTLYNTSRLSLFYSSLKGGKNGKSSSSIEALNGIFTWFEGIITRTEAPTSNNDVPREVNFIPFLIELFVTLPFSSSDEILFSLQKIQSIFSMSFDWIISKDFLKEQFVLLKGLSYAINYLIKSYPQVTSNSFNLEDQNGTSTSVKPSSSLLQRVPIEFEKVKMFSDDESLEISHLHDFVISQPSIPSLLSLQESKLRRKVQEDKNLKRIEAAEEEDFDISGFLIDDDEISSEESDDDEEEEEEEIEMDHLRHHQLKKSKTQNNLKIISKNTTNQNKKSSRSKK